MAKFNKYLRPCGHGEETAAIGGIARPHAYRDRLCFSDRVGDGRRVSNNPGKKGKPAPWVRREREDRERALQDYRLQQHPAYRAWHGARSEVTRQARAEAERLFPGLSGIGKSIKHGDKAVRAWDKANPNPMTWEESERLEEEFSKTYVPIDRS